MLLLAELSFLKYCHICIYENVMYSSHILFAWFLMLTYLTFIVFPNNYHLSSNHATPHDLKIESSRTMSVSVSPFLCVPRVYECIEIIISLDDDTQTLILETMNCEMELQKKKKNKKTKGRAENRRGGR